MDFFPLALDERVLDCDLAIENGTALARVDVHVYEAAPNYQRQIHRLLEARFRVQQFRSARPFKLDGGSLSEIHHDGTRTCYLSAFISSKASFTADLTISDSSGKILFDSASERAREKLLRENDRAALKQLDDKLEVSIQEYYQKGTRPEGPLVDSLLSSYLAACNDPDDELVYLYQLRDALVKRFDGEVATRQALNVSKGEWSDFGRIANHEPVQQGRHRGKFAGELRSATEEELVKARLFAKKLLFQFLQHLTASTPTTP